MKIGDMVRVKGDPRPNYGLGIILSVKREPMPAFHSRILEVFFTGERTYTIAESLLEVINERG